MSVATFPRRSVLFTLAASSLGSVALACSSSSGSPDTGSLKDSGGDTNSAADAPILNGLLADEYSAIATYAAAAPYLEKPSKGDPGAALAPVVLKIALHFSAQHTDHAAALVTAIKAVGGTPISNTAKFDAPAGFTLTVTNIMKLAANAERAAAIVYNTTVASLSAATNRFLAAAISGDEAQHFIVLYALLQGIAQPGTALSTTTAADVVPATFVASVGTGQGLEGIPDFSVTT
jgi:hypothetical protein